MNSLRNYLLVFLALATLGGAVLAWNQHLELIALRADSLGSTERDALQKKILDARKRQHELEDELAALRASASKKAAASAGDAQQNSPDDQRQRGRNGRFANMQALMNDPQFARLRELQQKAALDSSYAPLFKQLTQQLNLSPTQLAAFQNLLVQKQDAARDVITAARDQGLNPGTDRAAITQLIAQSNAEIDSQIQSTLGPDGYAQYQGYEQTLPQRNTVNQLQQSLSYTGTPLQDAQAQQLIQLLAANAPQNNNNPTNMRTLLNGNSATSRITDADITQAQGILSSTQVAALQQLQQQQQAQAELQRQIRAAAQQGSAAAPAGTTATTVSQPAGR